MSDRDRTDPSDGVDDSGEHREVVVVGGGQAGLAIGYFLSKQRRDFTIVEAAGGACGDVAPALGVAQAVHVGSLYSLPGLAFPGDPDRYPRPATRSPSI